MAFDTFEMCNLLSNNFFSSSGKKGVGNYIQPPDLNVVPTSSRKIIISREGSKGAQQKSGLTY